MCEAMCENSIVNGWCICERDSYRLISRRSVAKSIELSVSRALLVTCFDDELNCIRRNNVRLYVYEFVPVYIGWRAINVQYCARNGRIIFDYASIHRIPRVICLHVVYYIIRVRNRSTWHSKCAANYFVRIHKLLLVM